MAHRHKSSKKQTQILLLVVGFGILCFEGSAIKKCLEARLWKTTTGTITSSRIAHYRRRTYRTKIRYEYVANGTRHYSSNVNYGSFSPGTRVAKWIGWTPQLSKYPKGKTVSVFYDPKNPSNAVLERSLTVSGYALIIAGVAICSMTSFSLANQFTIKREIQK